MEGEEVQQMNINAFKFVPPKPVRLLFSEVVWESCCDKVLLTIDDSPTVDTLNLLDLLDQNDIKAAFFVNIPGSEEEKMKIRSISDRGHLVANHSMEHRKLRSLKSEALIEQIVRSKKILEEICGKEVQYFRPPYGAFDRSVYKTVRASGQRMVMWTLLTGDYLGDHALTATNINKYLRSNSIVVMHDNAKSGGVFEDTLNALVETVSKKGFVFGEPDECLR